MAEKKITESAGTFALLNSIDCNGHVEKKKVKNKRTGQEKELTYLSWAWAWQIAKTNFPDATYTIYENRDGLNYHTDGRTCWVKTGVTIGGIEHIEYLPVMDFNNNSIPLGEVTSFDVNKAIQRSLTKAIARHGLGLYIYAGEDMPDASDDEARAQVNAAIEKEKAKVPAEMLPGGPRFFNAVAMHAHGETHGGRTMREIWANSVHADAAMLQAFDDAVFNYRVNNNQQ